MQNHPFTTNRRPLGRRARRRLRLVGAFVAMTVALAMCAAGPRPESRELGEEYARAFSDDGQNRHVTWDDRACTFNERVARVRRLQLPATAQITMVPIARVNVAVKTPTTRPGSLDVVFHCDPPLEPCVVRTREYGSTVIGTERAKEHMVALAGSIADMPRIIADLNRLHAACGVAGVDGGR